MSEKLTKAVSKSFRSPSSSSSSASSDIPWNGMKLVCSGLGCNQSNSSLNPGAKYPEYDLKSKICLKYLLHVWELDGVAPLVTETSDNSNPLYNAPMDQTSLNIAIIVDLIMWILNNFWLRMYRKRENVLKRQVTSLNCLSVMAFLIYFREISNKFIDQASLFVRQPWLHRVC